MNSRKLFFVLMLTFGSLGLEDFMDTKAVHATMTGEVLYAEDFFFLFLVPFLLF